MLKLVRLGGLSRLARFNFNPPDLNKYRPVGRFRRLLPEDVAEKLQPGDQNALRIFAPTVIMHIRMLNAIITKS